MTNTTRCSSCSAPLTLDNCDYDDRGRVVCAECTQKGTTVAMRRAAVESEYVEANQRSILPFYMAIAGGVGANYVGYSKAVSLGAAAVFFGLGWILLGAMVGTDAHTQFPKHTGQSYPENDPRGGGRFVVRVTLWINKLFK